MTEIRPTEDMETGTANWGATFDDHMHGAGKPTDEHNREGVRRIEEAASQRPRGEGVIFTDLPDACVCLIVSYLSPKDLARSACVCLGFRDTLDSDSVWDQFVPKSALKVVGPNDELKAATKKKIFSFLRKPFLLRETLAYWLDQGTGGECYSVAAKGLRIVWGDDNRYWEWSPGSGSRYVFFRWKCSMEVYIN